MKAGVVVFPGSNCDFDAYYAFKHVLNSDVDMIWHKETRLNQYDFVVLPGGFSYGDYLRSGAIARFSPLMTDIAKKAHNGLPVLGICNGFQILTESHLLPGALLKNINLRFVCKYVYKIPVAHGEGCYHTDEDGLKRLQDNQQIVFTYVNEKGETTAEANPNGSIHNIAGICNQKGNVIGMMPHPERAAESLLYSDDGKKIMQSILNAIM